MKSDRYLKNKSFLLFPFSILFLLVIGVFISIIQVQQKTNTQSSADVNTPTPTAALVNCVVPTNAMGIAENEQQLFDQINAYRQQNNLPPLSWSQTLKRSAAWESSDMLSHTTLSHTDSLGRDITTRLMNCGYPTPAYLSELIDSGSSSSADLFHAWQHASAQSSQLLGSNFTEGGLAMAGSSQSDYWTLDLGGPRPTMTPTMMPKTTITPTPSNSSRLTVTPVTTITQFPPTSTPRLIATPTTIQSVLTATPLPTETPTPTFILSGPTITPLPTKPYTPTSTPRPTIDPHFVANPNDMQVFVSVKLQGIGKDGNPAPLHQSRRIQIGVYDSTNTSVKTGTGYVTFDGSDLFRGIVHLGTVLNDTYYIKIIADNTLQTVVMPEFQTLSSSRLNVLPEVVLIQGDLNADNVIDITDYNLALLCFQNASCDQNGGTKGSLNDTTNPTPVLAQRGTIDFNDNGVIDATDYNLLLQNYWAATGD